MTGERPRIITSASDPLPNDQADGFGRQSLRKNPPMSIDAAKDWPFGDSRMVEPVIEGVNRAPFGPTERDADLAVDS
jgi:hypothetical protein